MARIRPFYGKVEITTEYGTAQASRRGYHTGVDYALNTGTAVIAPENGVIVRNGDGTSSSDGRGYFVVMKGDSGTYHQLFHLNRMGHKSGRVAQGDTIGYTGNTGFSSGPHLHWETTRNDDRNSDFSPGTWLFADFTPYIPPVQAPVAKKEFVRVFGDFRTLYKGPGTTPFNRIAPNSFGGFLDYEVIQRSGNFVKIRTSYYGDAWIYVGQDVAYLTQFYNA